MCLVDQEADSQEDQADHELDDQLLPYKLKPAVKADIDHRRHDRHGQDGQTR